MSAKDLLRRLSPLDWVAIGLLLVYVIGFSWMTIRQHESFQTNALDLAKFDQAIWNTAHGAPLKSGWPRTRCCTSRSTTATETGC